MATEVILPRVDMDMTEGKIAQWYVRNGDAIRKGQVIFEIETDKATMEIEATADGVLQGSDGATDVVLPVGQVVGWILQPGESIPIGGAAAPVAPTVAKPAAEERVDAMPVPAGAAADDNLSQGAGQAQRQLRATPLARSLARAQGANLLAINGSGPAGRVLARDLPQRNTNTPHAGASAGHLHLHWFNRGNGVPLVLLHGFGTSSGSWRALAQQLGDVPALGIDLPNHGKSPRAAVADLHVVARWLLARLDQEGITSLHLAGHSMGGGAALALAPMLQQRLRSVTLLAPLGLGPQINGAFIAGMLRATRLESLQPWLALLFGDATRPSASFAATAWSELASAESRAALADMAYKLLPDGTQAESLRDRLTELAVPVKLIWGTHDHIVPPLHAAGVPGAVAQHLLPGIGHLPQVEAVALVAQLLRQQLAAGNVGGGNP